MFEVRAQIIELNLRGKSGLAESENPNNQRSIHSFHFFGNFCFSFSTGAKRSPCFSTRARTLSERNFSRSAFFLFKQLATSSHATGVETVGSSLARKL